MQTLSICIVTWNSMKFIKDCLDSIMRQTVWIKKSFNIKIGINIVDNGSQDGTLEFIHQNYQFVHILKNINNLGFSRAYNQAIKMQQTDWVLVLNVDMILEPDFLEKILTAAKNAKDSTGALGGKILKIETVIENGGLSERIKSDKIDSYGLEVKKSRQIKNIGEGEVDEGQYDEMQEVFGFTGACILFKREALEDVVFKDEYFDNDFFAYQEDYDLAYRLQLYNWKSIFVPSAKSYHFRSANLGTLSPWKFRKIIKARKQKSQLTSYHSYKNHLFVLLKNEISENFWRNLSHILWFEFKKFIYLLFFEIKTLGSLKHFFKLLGKMKLKRKIIMSRRKVTAEYMRSLMSS